MNPGKTGSKATALGMALALLLLPLLTPSQDVTGQQEQSPRGASSLAETQEQPPKGASSLAETQEQQLSLAEQAAADAKRDSWRDLNKKEGLIIGGVTLAMPLVTISLNTRSPVIAFGVPVLGVFLYNLMPPPSPPASRLRGMPTAYAEVYLKQYRKSYQGQRLGWTILGWLLSGAVITALALGFDL